MPTLKVEILNGVTPLHLHVDIKQIKGTFHNTEDKTGSFTDQLDLLPGEYLITVAGVNPPNGKVVADLTGTFQKGPTPSAHQEKDTEQFAIFFFFTV